MYTQERALVGGLAAYERQYEAIKADVRALTDHLSDAQFNWRPQPGTWSIAECLGHLLVTGGAALAALDRMIAHLEATGRRSEGPYRHTWLGSLFIRMTEPPYRMKVKTASAMEPPPDERLTRVVPAFVALQESLQKRLYRANGLDLGAVQERGPAGFPMTAVQWFPFVAAHERRHLWQARNVLNHPHFPRA